MVAGLGAGGELRVALKSLAALVAAEVELAEEAGELAQRLDALRDAATRKAAAAARAAPSASAAATAAEEEDGAPSGNMVEYCVEPLCV
jgi:hypothetical protein